MSTVDSRPPELHCVTGCASMVPAQVATNLQFDRTTIVAGSSFSFSANVSGSNLTPQTFFDIRFTAPGGNVSDVALNWQSDPLAQTSDESDPKVIF